MGNKELVIAAYLYLMAKKSHGYSMPATNYHPTIDPEKAFMALCENVTMEAAMELVDAAVQLGFTPALFSE